MVVMHHDDWLVSSTVVNYKFVVVSNISKERGKKHTYSPVVNYKFVVVSNISKEGKKT